MSTKLNLFYALPINVAHTAHTSENLTNQEEKDLVKAHLMYNYSYFGSVDKTLSGFYILDSEGDNYTLLDLRDTQAVYWQDHETRDIYLRFETFDDYTDFLKEKTKAQKKADKEDEDFDEDVLRKQYNTKKKFKSSKAILTKDLADRYQWLVHFLAQKMKLRGKEMSDLESDTKTIIRNYLAVWKTPQMAEQAFNNELPTLLQDPHLAVYWLLYLAIFNEQKKFNQVIEICKTSKVELYTTFAKQLKKLLITDTLNPVPYFRERRSLMLYWIAFETEEPNYTYILDAWLADPIYDGNNKAWNILQNIKNEAQWQQLSSILSGINIEVQSVYYLKARLDEKEGKAKSEFADKFVDAIVKQENIENNLVFLGDLLPLLSNKKSAIIFCDKVLASDLYHRGAHLILIQLLNEQADSIRVTELQKTLNKLNEVREILLLLLDKESAKFHNGIKLWEKETEEKQVFIAKRMLYCPDKTSSEVTSLMFNKLVNYANDSENLEPLKRGLAHINLKYGPDVDKNKKIIKDIITSEQHPFVNVIKEILLSQEEVDNISKRMDVENTKESLLELIAPIAHTPTVFDFLIKAFNQKKLDVLQCEIVDKLFRPGNKDSKYDNSGILQALANNQAQQVATILLKSTMIKPKEDDENYSLFWKCVHALSRFDHTGAEDQLIAALDDDFANDSAQAHYNAVRNLKTVKSKQALKEQLFKNKVELSWLNYAIAEQFTNEYHHQILAEIKQQQSLLAANRYFTTLIEYVKQNEPILELYHMVKPIKPSNTEQKSLKKFILLETTQLALTLKNYSVAKEAFLEAQTYKENAINDYKRRRNSTYENPFEKDKNLQKQIDDLLSGKIEKKAENIKAKAQLKQGKPNLKIKDKDLGLLANCTVRERFFTHKTTGEIWFADIEGKFFYFDGFNIAEPAFKTHFINEKDWRGNARIHIGKTNALLQTISDDLEVERLMAWCGQCFIDVARYDQHLFFNKGLNNSWQSTDSFALSFNKIEEAKKCLLAIKENLPKGYQIEDPFYRKGKGLVFRTWTDRKESGKMKAVLGCIYKNGQIRTKYDSEAKAIAAYNRDEVKWLKSGNEVATIEWRNQGSVLYLKPEDMTLVEYFDSIERDDSCDAEWHVNAIKLYEDYLKKYQLTKLINNLKININPPASNEDIALLQKSLPVAIPEALKDFWKKIGSAKWQLGKKSMEILSPKKMLELRDEQRNKISQKVTSEKGKGTIDTLDVLVIDENNNPITFFVSHPDVEDNRAFSNVYHKNNPLQELWWEKSLGWIFSTRFVAELNDSLQEACPQIAQMLYGQTYNPQPIKRRFELTDGKINKFWEINFDNINNIVSTCYGKIGTAGVASVNRYDCKAEAENAIDKAIKEKTKKGYKEVK